jgi:hypothetical protein
MLTICSFNISEECILRQFRRRVVTCYIEDQAVAQEVSENQLISHLCRAVTTRVNT